MRWLFTDTICCCDGAEVVRTHPRVRLVLLMLHSVRRLVWMCFVHEGFPTNYWCVATSTASAPSHGVKTSWLLNWVIAHRLAPAIKHNAFLVVPCMRHVSR